MIVLTLLKLSPGVRVSDVVLVTGVGPGTGKAVVERFAGAGYVVAMLARTEQRLIEIKETLNPYLKLQALVLRVSIPKPYKVAVASKSLWSAISDLPTLGGACPQLRVVDMGAKKV